MKKNTLFKIGGVVFVFVFVLAPAVYAAADTWTETATTIYQTDNTKNVGIGTATPTYEIQGVSDQGSADPFLFQGFSGAWGERDIFSIKTSDYISTAQDESSLLQVWATGAWSDEADATALAELTYTGALPTVTDRHFYLLGRTANEGQLNWGISLLDADFWTKGDINGGATSTDCGGTGAACFNSPTFHLAASGDSYINGGNLGIGTTTPTQALDVSGYVRGSTGLCIGSDCRTAWPTSSSSGVTGSGTTNYLTKWSSSSAIGDSIIYDDGTYVGIGTTSPTAGLHLANNDGALFTGTLGSGSIPVEGAGTRMMWYPGKAAFRVGNATGTEWDNSNVGYYSVATGAWTEASGVSSVAMGDNNQSTGDYSTSFGFYNEATGNAAFATGSSSNADGSSSATFNSNTDADAMYATAFGRSTTAESYASLVLGRYNESLGSNTTWVDTDPLFVVGNGTSTSARSDAFVIYKNGEIEITGDIVSDGEICIGNGC